MMRYLNYLLVSLASAMVAAYTALWFANPAPLEQPHAVTLPPLTVQEHQGDLLLWGGWRTVAGYEHPGANAIEIRCNRESSSCTEAYATLLHHSEGEDLEAQVYRYEITSWSEQQLEAVAKGAMAECLDRVLHVNLKAQSANLEWKPAEGCEGDTGAAVLIGDPV